MFESNGQEIGQEVVLRRREWTHPTYAPAALDAQGEAARAAGASDWRDLALKAWYGVWILTAAIAAVILIVLAVRVIGVVS